MSRRLDGYLLREPRVEARGVAAAEFLEEVVDGRRRRPEGGLAEEARRARARTSSCGKRLPLDAVRDLSQLEGSGERTIAESLRILNDRGAR